MKELDREERTLKEEKERMRKGLEAERSNIQEKIDSKVVVVVVVFVIIIIIIIIIVIFFIFFW